MSHTAVQLTLKEKFALVPALAAVIFHTLVSIVGRLWRAKSLNGRTVKRAVAFSVGGNAALKLSLRQTRAFAPTTGTTIERFCASNSIRHSAIHLSQQADNFPPPTLHFVDCDPDKDGAVLLYFHGGGYAMALQSAGHLLFARRTAHAARAGLVLLEYTLTPELPYPGQLAQAAAALRFLLQQRDAANIIVGGDSAGGNLVLALLAHMQTPHPTITPITFPREDQQLRAVFCASPWANNDCLAPSYASNAKKDFLSAAMMRLFIDHWRPVLEHVWATPVLTDRAFWTGVRARRVLLTVGGDEVFRDDVLRMADAMGAEERAGAKIQLAVCPGEVHVQCVMDADIGIEDGGMATTIVNWLESV